MMDIGYWCKIYKDYEESSENSWYHLICLDYFLFFDPGSEDIQTFNNL